MNFKTKCISLLEHCRIGSDILTSEGCKSLAALFLWGIYCLTYSFYFYESGLPQIADYIMACVFLLSFIASLTQHHDGFFSDFLKSNLYILCFLLYVLLITVIRIYMDGGHVKQLIYPVYMSFNVVVFLSGVYLGGVYKKTFLKLTVLLLVLTIIVQFINILFFNDFQMAVRQTGFFNNPNQLGYAGLLTLVSVVAAWHAEAFENKLLKVFMALCVAIIVLSVSKAAVLGVILFALYFFYFKPLYAVILFVLSLFIIYLSKDTEAVNTFVVQFVYDLNKGDTSFEARGYSRLISYPEYILFGAAEGNVTRFNEEREFHSTFGTLLFSYGLPGTVLFFLMIWNIVKENIWKGFMLLAPVFAYGLAHQGIRFTLFWVTLSVITVSLANSSSKDVVNSGKEA